MKQMALIVAFLGVLSFILGVVAENKKVIFFQFDDFFNNLME